MGRILVHGADMDGDHVATLTVELLGLSRRTVDRETAIGWMRDGHSLVPVRGGRPGQALQLLERVDGDDVTYVIRDDHATEGGDALGDLPPASA